MVTRIRQPGQEHTRPDTRRFLTAAEYFLRNRSFADCRKYALRPGILTRHTLILSGSSP
ncbi:UNVERIFIED_CONTAM: hypothetical protein Slati_0029800 [Sesamum latifolium]|uniref:Uncharacterized protein n=1 Tax=Sesamum latifolium TaxID=2727402 RepID=A0AAW2Y7F5_9LAMI